MLALKRSHIGTRVNVNPESMETYGMIFVRQIAHIVPHPGWATIGGQDNKLKPLLSRDWVCLLG
jgi:hypothetical protein